MASVKIYNIQENMQLVLEYGTEWTEDEKSDKEEIVFHGKLSQKMPLPLWKVVGCCSWQV